MYRRIRIIMDHEYKIKPDGKTNWVTTDFEGAIEYGVDAMQKQPFRETLVIRPKTNTLVI